MFKNLSNKILNLFKSNKRPISSKALDKLTNDLGGIIRYKSLIPNLLEEFEIQNKYSKERSNSYSLKNTKLTLSENKLRRSNSVSMNKLKKKKVNIRCSFGRHYFTNADDDTKHLTSKNLHRGSFYDIKQNIKLGKIENTQKRKKFIRKTTIDPQDTREAHNIEFVINGEEIEIEINDTKEKLEEYQEKMRKTQLRYYVFKKITSYKSSLRRYFQKYRSIVQLLAALEEKKEEIKENNIENSKLKIKMLKNILKNRAYKEQKELTKYLLKFYYNSKYAAGIASLRESLKNKDENKNDSDKNDGNKNVGNKNNDVGNVTKVESKKEEEKKELTPEEIEKAKRKRNKELRDLFNNKVKERQKWLHDRFVRFYYKGLLWAMKTGNIKNNTSSSAEDKTETNNDSNKNDTSEKAKTEQASNENNLINMTSSEIDTININKEIEKKEEEPKEEKKPKKLAPNRLRDRSKGLRKILHERNKEKTNILRKYFFKFLSNGILLSLKKTTMQSSKSLTTVNIDEENKGNDGEKKEEEEKNWITEEKKRRRQEEEQKKKELWEKLLQLMLKIFTKKDQIQCGKERNCLQQWNLRAKILAIADLTTGYKKLRKSKAKKKKKKTEGNDTDNKEIKEGEN